MFSLYEMELIINTTSDVYFQKCWINKDAMETACALPFLDGADYMSALCVAKDVEYTLTIRHKST